MKRKTEKTKRKVAHKSAPTAPQLRKSIREKYTLLLKTAGVLVGFGRKERPSAPRIELEIFEDGLTADDPRWEACVYPLHGDVYAEGYAVGHRRSEQYTTKRQALIALDALLSAVMGAMNPFVKNAGKAR